MINPQILYAYKFLLKSWDYFLDMYFWTLELSLHHPDALKGVTGFGIPIQATRNSQKLWNYVLKIPM